MKTGEFLAHLLWADLVASRLSSSLPVLHVGRLGQHLMLIAELASSDGGTESLGITAGETRNPTKNMPRVVRLVFFRSVQVANSWFLLTPSSILLFYVLSILIIGLNGQCQMTLFFTLLILLSVPYTYPNLSMNYSMVLVNPRFCHDSERFP